MNVIPLICLMLLFRPNEEPVRSRNLMVAAATNEDSANTFFRLCKSEKQLTPLKEGYKGLAEIMLCNYGYNPFTKFSRFLSGKAALEHALRCQPHNTELHFLRFVVQTKCPALLGYRCNLDEDKAVLKAFLEDPSATMNDGGLTALIRSFLWKTSVKI